jgi:predicted DNA-binding transcriptional regulator AlpA
LSGVASVAAKKNELDEKEKAMTTGTMTAAGPRSANSGPPPMGRRLLSVSEVAQLYRCDDRSVFRWADCGIIPTGVKLGSLRRWDAVEIERHIANGCPKVRTVSAIGGGR